MSYRRMVPIRLLTGLALALIVACGGGSSDPDAGVDAMGGPRAPFPAHFCPGSPGCDGVGDGVFRVGAGRADINPTLIETEWVDEDEDGEFDSGEDFTDTNGNEKFDAVWMAGYGNGRPAVGFHSDIWARAIVFEWNDVRVGLTTVDTVGWMFDDCEATRALIPAALDLDWVVMVATHMHEGPDTMGLWGIKELVTGVDPDHQQLIRERIVAALTDAVADLRPATMAIAQVETLDEDGNSKPYVGDGRDPVIIDPTMTIMQFASVAAPDETIATLVHWAGHPEYSGSENNWITADYPYLLREVIENGIAANPDRALPAMDGLGGEVVFMNGAVGGQIGPKHVEAVGLDGNLISSSGLDKADAVGRNLGRLALETITNADMVEDIAAPTLSVRTGEVDAAVENTFYHVASLVGVFDRQFHGHNPEQPLGPGNTPYISTRVSYLQIGTVGMITAPGELHPELAVGGYDGSMSFGESIVDPGNENPPPLESAPAPPYLHDLLLANAGVDYPLIIGLGEDEMGYIVPAYNYVLDDNTPYIEDALGDHYEETNSVGPLVEAEIVGSMRELITWQQP